MIGKLKTVVLDAPDIARLAAFYTSLAGWTQQYADDEWITMNTADGWRVGLQLAPDHVPPQWPDQGHPQQMHLDFQVADLAAATAEAERLGARKIGGGEAEQLEDLLPDFVEFILAPYLGAEEAARLSRSAA